MNIKPELNFGTYSTCQMPYLERRDFAKYSKYNFINKNEYPELAEMEKELTEVFLRRMFYTTLTYYRKSGGGFSTTGSTESSLLVLQNALYNWKGYGDRSRVPKVVLDINGHHCWDRVCKHLGVEPIYIKSTTKEFKSTPNLKELRKALKSDDVILCVCCDMYTVYGSGDNLSMYGKECRELGIRLHLDSAISGFCSSTERRGYESYVDSINISNHKFGMVYPGCGWLLFQDSSSINPKMLVATSYLAGDFSSAGFSFTRSGGHIAAQYRTWIKNKGSKYSTNLEDLVTLAEGLAAVLKMNKEMGLVTQRGPVVYLLNPNPDLSSKLLAKGISVPTSTWTSSKSTDRVARIVLSHGKKRKHINKLIDAINSIEL